MSQARNLKPLKLKAWYKTKGVGTRVSARKDFPMRKDATWERGTKSGKARGRGDEDLDGQEGKEIHHMVVETPVFIPYSKESAIKRRLQEGTISWVRLPTHQV